MDVGTLIFVVLFYLVILVTGIWASKKGKAKGKQGLSGMFLAGRNMPLWIGALTMTATWVGGGYINGTAEAVFSSGMVWAQAPWGYALSLFIGGLFFAVPMRSKRYTTLLDPFQERYGLKVTALFMIPAVIGDIFWSAAILTALGYTFAVLLGIDFTTAIIVSSAIAVFYTLLGGLWSVAYTDVIQIGFIFFGLMIAVPFIVNQGGGLDTIWLAYRAHYAEGSSLIPDLSYFSHMFSPRPGVTWDKQIWSWIDYALLLCFGGIPWGVYFQRVLACPTPRSARGLSFIAAFGCLIMAVPPVLIGIAGVSVDWPQIPDGAMVLPYALKYLTPWWVSVIGLAAVASAVMSSIDSSMLSTASMFTWNIYRPLARKKNSRHLLVITKLAIVVVGICATGLALAIQSVYALWFLCADLVYVLLFPQLVMVLFSRRTNKLAALSGFLVGAVLRFGGGEPSLGLPAFIPYPMQDSDLGIYFPFRTVAMLASLVTIWIIGLLSAKAGEVAQVRAAKNKVLSPVSS